jgi:hypothetical protein
VAQAGPYGITQVDVPGIVGAYQQAKENRIRSLILQKQMEALDKQGKMDSAIQRVVSQAYAGGDATDAAPAASGSTPTTSPAALPSPATTAAQAPAQPAASATAPTAASTQFHVPSGAEREKLIGTLMAIDAPTAEKYIDLFAKMDKSQVDQFNQKNGQIMQLMGGLLQQSAQNRKAAIQQYAPDLQKLGYTPEQIANFDPSDENLRSEMARHMDASKVAEFVKPDLMGVSAGTTLIDKNHPGEGAVYTAPADYHTFMVHNADGTDSPYGFDPKTGRAFQLRDSGQSGVSGSAPGGFDHAVETVLSNEGGYNPHDMNGAPVNFGINQTANPNVDVKNLTRDQARQIYHDKYWVPSGAENLPANLQTPYFDTYIRNPAEAKKALEQSGGDPVKFMQISSNYFQTLAKEPNGAKYAKAWAARDAKNLAIATGGGGMPITGKPLSPDAGTDETAKFIGGQVALGQPMPPLGMGKEAAQMRKAILGEATRQWRAMGITPGEANVIAAQNKSGLAELAKIAQIKATVQTAENTASSNASQVLSLLGSAGSTGSPIFNAWQQAGRRATGNVKVSAFDVAVKTLATEYARVMSGGNSTQLSDSARHEADALIHTSMTPDQFRSAISQMKIDMANRTKGIEQERQATLQQIRTGGRGPAPRSDDGWTTLPSGIKFRKIQ